MLDPQSLTMRKYHLRCRVKVVRVQGQTILKEGRAAQNIEADCVVLIPEEGTEKDTFLTAWLPEDSSEAFELPTFMPHPIASPCRMKISRKNAMCDEHHLFVMSHGCEQDLLKHDGRTVPVIILPEDQEESFEGGAQNY